jgi:hypothetical protein
MGALRNIYYIHSKECTELIIIITRVNNNENLNEMKTCIDI